MVLGMRCNTNSIHNLRLDSIEYVFETNEKRLFNQMDSELINDRAYQVDSND